MPWSSIWKVVKLILEAFLQGKVTSAPPAVPIKPLPAGLVLPRDERRPVKVKRADGLPEVDAEPDAPLSTKTLGLVLFIVFGMPIITLTMLSVLEWRTLSDDTPGNHVTATLRAAWKREPGAVFLATLVWVAFLVAIVFGIAGHIFWQ